MIFLILIILAILVFVIIILIYVFSDYRFKSWRPISKLTILKDQIDYWGERLIACLTTFQKINSLDTNQKKAFIEKICDFNNNEIVDISNINSEIDAKIENGKQRLDTNNIESVKEYYEPLFKIFFEELPKTYSNNHIDRLLLKSKIIMESTNDDLENNISKIFSSEFKNVQEDYNLQDLYLRYFLLDFIIDFTKTFCEYNDFDFYKLYHKETLNFYTKQASRDVDVSEKREKTSEDVSGELLMSFKSMIPFLKKFETDIEKKQIEELNRFKEPILTINQNNIDYLSDDYFEIIENSSSSSSSSSSSNNDHPEQTIANEINKKQDLLWRMVFVEVAKVDINYNYKLLTKYFDVSKDKIKNDLHELSEFYKQKKPEYTNKEKCLMSTDELKLFEDLPSEYDLINKIQLRDYHQEGLKDKTYDFEKLISSLESKLGPGLLLMDHDNIIGMFHKLVLLEIYERDKQVINSIKDLDASEKKMYYEIIVALQEINILISKDFPSLLYYDMKREGNIERLLVYYIDVLRRSGNQIETILEILIYSYECFNGRKFSRHIPLYNSYLNRLVDFVYSERRKLNDIANNIPRYIGSNFTWAVEGFQEQYSKVLKQEEDRRNKSGTNVIEHFGGLKKLFKGIMSFIKTLIKLIGIVTNPVKLLKLILITSYTLFMIAFALVETYTNTVTGVCLIVSLSIFLSHYVAFLISYSLFIYVYSIIDLLLLQGYITKITYNYLYGAENDIRNWYNVPGFEQGNIVSMSLLGTTRPCSARYKQELMFCKRIEGFLPSFSHQSSIYKLYNNISPTGILNLGDFEVSTNFRKKTNYGKKSEIKKSNLIKRSYIRNSDKYFDKHKNVTNITKTICSNINCLDLSDSHKSLLKEQCSKLYCKNGNYISACVNNEVQNRDVQYIDTLNNSSITLLLNSLYYVLILFLMIGLLSTQCFEKDYFKTMTSKFNQFVVKNKWN